MREQTAEILEIPVSKILVIPMEIGGGFGGKVGVYLEPVVVLLSRKSGYRPVKMTMTRSDVLAATGPTSGSYFKVRMGANREGKITAVPGTARLRSGGLSQLAGWWGNGSDVCTVSDRERADRWVRCFGEQAANASVSRSRWIKCRVRL